MHLYRGTSEQFIADAVQSRLAHQLAERFFDEFRYKPSPSEVMSWRNSLGAMATVLQLADLRDQGILVELKLPLSSKRLDVMVTGSNPTSGDSAVVVELKQWTEVGRSNITDCVTVDFGGRLVDHLHPSRQVAQYQRYLIDTHPAFSDGAIALDACAYLHFAQHDPSSPLWHADFTTLLGANPSFTGDELDAFATFLDQRVGGPDAGDILERVGTTAFKPRADTAVPWPWTTTSTSPGPAQRRPARLLRLLHGRSHAGFPSESNGPVSTGRGTSEARSQHLWQDERAF